MHRSDSLVFFSLHGIYVLHYSFARPLDLVLFVVVLTGVQMVWKKYCAAAAEAAAAAAEAAAAAVFA